MKTTTQSWVVYDLETDKIVGSWNEYADAEQFWSDALHTMETNWAVFPEVEVAPVEWYE